MKTEEEKTSFLHNGQRVTWRREKGKEEHLVCSPEATAPDYVALATQIGELVTRNQVQYGNAFGRSGDVLRIFYPNGIQPDQYDDMMAITRIIDKQFRIANGSQGEESPYRDISGYGLLGYARQEGGKTPEAYMQADLDAADARSDARHEKLVIK